MEAYVKNNQPKHYSALKHAFTGSILGLLFASFFVFLIIKDSQSPKLIMFLPLLTVSLGGGMGGFIYYLLKPFRTQNGFLGYMARFFSILLVIAGLWLSLIAALAVLGLWD